VKLYAEICDVLLEHWRRAKEIDDSLTAEQKREVLQPLAEEMMTRKAREIATQDALTVITPHLKQVGIVESDISTFLEDVQSTSGLLLEQETGMWGFAHLTFQEYLCAKALGGKTDFEQQKLLLNDPVLKSPEWKEVLLLFCGILYKQGMDKINGFFNALLLWQKTKNELKTKARLFGLIGAMERDLSPYQYKIDDPFFITLKKEVMAIFDKDKARTIQAKIRCDAADALGQAGDPRLLKDNFVTIPACTFLMGAQKVDSKAPNYDPAAYPDESPVHEVRLTAYKIGKYPVTVGEYTRFIEADGYKNKAYWQAGGFGEFHEPENWETQVQFPTRPVVNVSWFEAKAFTA
jgi:hypothetical protein